MNNNHTNLVRLRAIASALSELNEKVIFVATSIIYPVSEQQSIRIFSAPYFVATKFEAFNSFRHGSDPRINSDFEDIIYVFDNRVELLREIS